MKANGGGNLLSDTLLLIGLQYRLAWNSFKAQKTGRKLLYALLGLGGLALGGFSSAVGAGIGELAQRSGAQFEALAPGLVLTVALIVLSVSSFGIALGALFLSGDLERLMVAPVNRRAVFIAKLLDGLWFYWLLLAILAAPALFAYGLAMNYAPAYFVFSTLTLAAAPLLGTGLGALATLLAARFAPARRVREVLTAAAGLLGLLIGLAGQLPRLLFSASDANGSSVQDFAAGTEQLKHTLAGWANAPIPTLWAGRGLVAAGHGDLAAGALGTAVYLGLTLGFFAGCVLLADRLYATGWSRMQGSGVARRKPRRVQSARLAGAPPELALAVKDWRFVTRDLRMLPRLLSPLVSLPILYLSFLYPLGSSRTAKSAYQSITAGDFGGVTLAVGVLAIGITACSTLSSIGMSMEGRALWILKVAPISPWFILRGKLLSASVPFVILSTAVFGVGVVTQHRNAAWALYGLAGIWLVGIGTQALSVALSVPWANYAWEDPRKMSPGWGGCLSFLGYGVYGIPAGLMLCLPALAARLSPAYLPGFGLVGILAALLWTALLPGGALLYAARALPKTGVDR